MKLLSFNKKVLLTTFISLLWALCFPQFDMSEGTSGPRVLHTGRTYKNDTDFNLENEKFKKDAEIAAAKKAVTDWKKEEIKSSERRTERYITPFTILGSKAEISKAEISKAEISAENSFGYNLFLGMPSTFAQFNNIPVPADYIMGVGDVVLIQLFGKETETFELTVSREGKILIPEVGLLTVAGLKIEDMKSLIKKNIKEMMLGVKAEVSLASMRSIQVFILGEATCPGSYTVSALSTITNALIASGGVKTSGSLRNVQLKREGKVIRTLDLYDILLKGNTEGDVRLQPGDVIFIPTVGRTASIEGAVIRPARYELLTEKTVEDLINLAGGLSSFAYDKAGQLKRLDQEGDFTLKDINLKDNADLRINIENGDTLYIQSAKEYYRKSIALLGNVKRPGGYAWKEGMKLRDLILSEDDVLPQTELDYILVRRAEPDQRISVFSVNLNEILANNKVASNDSLKEGDQIFIFSMEEKEKMQSVMSSSEENLQKKMEKVKVVQEQEVKTLRRSLIDKLISELRLQSNLKENARVVEISGVVQFPGEYPLEEGMKISDLLRAAGNLKDSAYTAEASLTRYIPDANGEVKVENIVIDLSKIIEKDAQENIYLNPGDYLSIKMQSKWLDRPVVEIAGEVNHPGKYAMKPGETLKDLILRAGGFTEFAYPEGSIFIREDLKRQEEEMLRKMAARLESDMAIFIMKNSNEKAEGGINAASMKALMESVLAETKSAQPIGRMIIDVNDILSGKAIIPVENQDKLLIPKKPVSIAVMGEVQFPSFHVFSSDMKPGEYIDASGGLSRKADKLGMFVISANGASAYKRIKKNRWGLSGTMRPGDTIIVPVKIDISSLSLWTQTTQILYNLSMSAAAIATFNKR